MDVWKFKLLNLFWLLLAVVPVVATPVTANEKPVAPTPICHATANNPCIALVLGGGGARGAAHIAVLQTLQQQGIDVDMVIGTSIGAFIGGLYASGHSPNEIAVTIKQLPWDQGARDKVDRDKVPPRAREWRDDFPIQPDIGVGYKGLKLPRGMLHGQSMATLIEHAYGVVPVQRSFNDLPIPFRAVATDLASGEAVVLSQGNLLHAVQASMSIPGVVRPLELDGRLLVDGGVANNLPIDVARQLGASHIIAVAIDAPLLKRNELADAVAVTEQLTNFLVQRAVREQRALLQPQDVLIIPNVQQLGTLDFERFDEAYQGGVQAVRAALPRLKQLAALRRGRHATGATSTAMASAAAIRLHAIDLNNHTFWSDERLLQRLDLPLQQPLSLADVQAGIERMYGLDTLERVTSSLYAEGERQYRLALTASDKSWGPAYLSFRLQLQDDFHNQHRYQLAGSYLLTGLSDSGAWWQSDIALGTDKKLNTLLDYPVGISDVSMQLQAAQSRTVLGLETNAGLSDGELTNRELLLRSGLSWTPLDPLQLNVSAIRRDGEYLLPQTLAQQLQFDTLAYVRRGGELYIEYDSLDHAFFPSRGQQLQIRWQHLIDAAHGVRGRSDSTKLQWRGAWHRANHQWSTRLRFDRYQSDQSTAALEQFALGGLLNLSGYPQNFLFGSEVRFAALMYRYQLTENRFSLFHSPLYLGASLERGQVRDARLGLISLDNPAPWLWAASVFAGWDSPLGPLYLGYGHADGELLPNPYRFYLSLGYPF